MARRPYRTHHVPNEDRLAPLADGAAGHPGIRVGSGARPSAARAHALPSLGGARAPLAGDRARAARLVAGVVRHATAPGQEPGALLRVQLELLRLAER